MTLYSIGDAVLTTDAGGRVTFMNPVAEAMTGWTLQDAIGAPHELVFNVLDSDTGEALESPVRRCLQNTRVFYLEDGATLISRKGEQHDIQNCAAPVRTRDGEIIGTVLVFQNVTKARAMQRELSYHASHDALTGLFNRTKFEEERNAPWPTPRSGRPSMRCASSTSTASRWSTIPPGTRRATCCAS